MDVSSEMIHSLLPVFLVGPLGVSVLVVGVIEGAAEATALLTKVVSGVLSDRLRRRKSLAVLGYALAAVTKPAFALAQGAGLVVAARFVDRVGKGIRGAPRDALVADLVPREQRGAAYGLRQALDTVGAVAGPVVAMLLMVAFAGDFRRVFWGAAIPAVLAVVVLLLGVQEPRLAPGEPVPNPLRREALRQLGRPFVRVVAVGALFTLARFSAAFLVLRAAELAVPTAAVPLVMVLMNLVYSASAYPFGRLADAVERPALLAGGLAVLVLADLALATAAGWPGLALGVALWGLHLGMTQGLLSALVADSAPAALRGTAFGFFNLASGLAMLAASALAGLLWQTFGSRSTFLVGAGFAGVALAAVLVARVVGVRAPPPPAD